MEAWASAHADRLTDHHDADGGTRALAQALRRVLACCMAVPEGGALDVRSLCLAREILARHSGLADFAFAMQGLGTGPITLFGSDELKRLVLPGVRAGTTLAAFALSEPEAGSDVAALATAARRDGNAHWLIDGEKSWISNGGIAGSHVVFARSGDAPGARGLTAFWVPGDAPGLITANASKSRPRTRWPGCASVACACLTRTASAHLATASRWRWRRSTCSAPRWVRQHSASPGAALIAAACSAPPRASSSARPCSTSR